VELQWKGCRRLPANNTHEISGTYTYRMLQIFVWSLFHNTTGAPPPFLFVLNGDPFIKWQCLEIKTDPQSK
jgi:hypothetical protein